MSLALVIGGAMSCFAFGLLVGRSIKMVRQFFDFF